MNDTTRRGPGLTDAAVRLVTREATRVPLLALTVGLQAWERTRGLRERALRQGGVALELVAHTPLGRFLPHPVIDDNADQEAEQIAAAARQTRLTPVATPPEPQHEEVPEAAREAGAPGAVTDEVERITDKLDVEEPQSREELPIPDFDNVSIGSLRARLRSLSLEQLATLREWEQTHAHRLPVLTLLDNRIAKVSAEQTDQRSTPYPSESAASPDRR